jgi:hypothetical protein
MHPFLPVCLPVPGHGKALGAAATVATFSACVQQLAVQWLRCTNTFKLMTLLTRPATYRRQRTYSSCTRCTSECIRHLMTVDELEKAV